MRFEARAPAKVNLTLEVGPRGEDGYHGLRSVFLRLGFADRLIAALTPGAASDSLSVRGPVACPLEGNLVLAALAAVRERVVAPLPSLGIELEKRIPLATGLGGGSSDAATTLALAEAAWGIGLSVAERLALAQRLGSDVPFFASDAAAALVEGRGERVTALPGVRGEAGVLLALKGEGLSTGAIYARHDDLAARRTGPKGGSLTDELARALQAGLDGAGLSDWAHELRTANDLWPAACSLMPALAGLRELLEAVTGRPWLLTGSGSALFALYPSGSEAAQAGAALAGRLAGEGAAINLIADDLRVSETAWRHP